MGQKLKIQIYRTAQKQVPEAGAAHPGDDYCAHNMTFFMVYSAQFRSFLSQFDGFVDPSHFIIKPERFQTVTS